VLVYTKRIVGEASDKCRDLDIIYDYEEYEKRATMLYTKDALPCYPLYDHVGGKPIEVDQLE
jgi:hypothetical protein